MVGKVLLNDKMFSDMKDVLLLRLLSCYVEMLLCFFFTSNFHRICLNLYANLFVA